MSSRRIAVLALQGDFAEHEQALASLGVETFEIRQARDAQQEFDGLVIPGGESTVMGKLLRELDLFEPLRRRLVEQRLPVMATCAGLILLAKDIEADATRHFATLDVTVRRNAYGRQLGSFQAEGPFAGGASIPMSFIRAPAIREVGSGVDVLASENGIPVAVRQGNILATAFHPELDPDTTIHSYFLSMVEEFVVS